MILRLCGLVAILSMAACEPVKRATLLPEVSGSTLLLDVSPAARPAMIGAYDFELLEPLGGNSCISRSNRSSIYWVGLQELAKLDPDPLTQQAIAAATYDAISRLDDVDTIVLTRVVAVGKGSDRVCATIHGRGVRLTKALPSSSASEQKKEDEE